MDFFNKLGIDWVLLVAQILNFVLLMLLLKRFLYKPIIKRIEKDESELEEAQNKKKMLDEERDTFLRQKKEEINEARKYNQKIITEADDIAKKIMESTREKADDENFRLIKQLRAQLQSHDVTLKKEYVGNLESQMLIGFIQAVEKVIPANLRKELQNNYFDSLLQEIEVFSSDMFKKTETPATLEYVFPLEQAQITKINELLAKRYGSEIEITMKQNKELLSGFNFEFNGIFIEKNLLADLKNESNIEHAGRS